MLLHLKRLLHERHAAISHVLAASLSDLRGMHYRSRTRLLNDMAEFSGIPSFEEKRLARSRRGQAIGKLLYTTPYERSLLIHDHKVVSHFHRSWRQAAKDPALPVAEAFHADCRRAMTAMGIENHPINLEVEVRPHQLQRHSGGQKLESLACVSVEKLSDMYNVRIGLNEHCSLWQSETPSPAEKVARAKVALHEITHVEQKIRRHENPHDAYGAMFWQANAVQFLMRDYAIYRLTLSERQAFFRQQGFVRMTKGHDMGSEDGLMRTAMRYCRFDLDRAFKP